MAKSKQKEVILPTEQDIEKPKRKRSSSYSRNKGNAYERKIVSELNELGFNVGTSRNNSKQLDNNKIDIYDIDGTLPCDIQLKCTQNIPSYFNIREESTANPERFVIIWSKQEKREVNIVSVGEVAILPKSLFYKLIKNYKESEE